MIYAHYNYLMISGFQDIEFFPFPNACAYDRDERPDLLVLLDLCETRFLHVQDFAAKWENCLELSVAPLFCAIMNKNAACKCKVMRIRNLYVINIHCFFKRFK